MSRSDKKNSLGRGSRHLLEITDLTHDAEGVGRVDGKVVFVPNAVPGDKVEVQVISEKKEYARGLIERIVEPSADRREPQCPLAEQCGGCQLQHLDYAAQLFWKEKQVQAALNRIGGLSPEIRPIIGCQSPYRYRNKGQFPVGRLGEQAVVGFFQKRTHQIVDLTDCCIQHPLSVELIRYVKEWVNRHSVPVYDEQAHKGELRHVVVRVSFSTDTAMLMVVTRTKKVAWLGSLVAALNDRFPRVVGIAQNVNPDVTNRILGSETKIVWGESYLLEQIGHLSFAVSPASFFQVNPLQTKTLYDQVRLAAQLTEDEIVWDLYCGTGTIGLYLANQAKKVYGIEVVPTAIDDARLNASINGIASAEFYCGKAEEMWPRLYAVKGGDVVILDPPRRGAETVLLQTIGDSAVNHIIYVSCNPASLARDLAYLATLGYRTLYVQPVDMFPQTSHVETVVLMSRVEK